MPINNGQAVDSFQSRLAAALDSVRPSPQASGPEAPVEATPSPTTLEAAEETEPPVESAETNVAPPMPEPVATPVAEEPTEQRDQPAQNKVVEETDDSFFDDPPPPGPAPEQQSQPQEPTATPLGSGDYVVKRGDCIASIAAEHGLFWETVWNDPGNADLRSGRLDPHVLLPGDRVHLRDKRRKEEPGATETRHRFKKKGEPCELLVTLLDEEEEPRAGAAYRLYFDGRSESGVLDAEGTLRVRLRAATRNARLIVGEAPFEEHYHLLLGALDPEESVSGVHARLRNLGYMAGLDSPDLAQHELSVFQSKHGLPATGELDETTQQRLRNKHFSVGE